MADLPKNSVALYRICTRKSVLGIGKYADLPIGDILKIDPEYVVWAYAALEKISLHKEIIAELGIREIKKPGVDMEVLWEYRRKISERFTAEERMHGAAKRKSGKRAEAYARLMAAKRENQHLSTKGHLQAVNQGHIKK